MILVLPVAALPTDLRLPNKVKNELEKNIAYQQAATAMADRLPDVAAGKFRILLGSPKLSKEAKAVAKIMLAEALIRSATESNGERNLATEALKLLEDKDLEKFPTTPIWRAEAMATLGRLSDASKALSTLPESHPMYAEATLTNARILISLNRKDEALNELQKLIQGKQKGPKTTAAMLATELAIEADNLEAAAKFLDQATTSGSPSASTAKLKEYLAARLTLSNEKFAEAANQFQSLINAPDPLTERLFLASHLGLVDAQAGVNKDTAIESLLTFIEKHPNAYNLTNAFDRLIDLLPEKTEGDHPARIKLREWSQEKQQPPATDLIPLDSASAASLPTSQALPITNQDLAALALYYRAKLHARSEQKSELERAIVLLARLRTLPAPGASAPSSLYLDLFSASLLETAYIHLKLDDPTMATFTLSVMEKVTFSPALKSQAIILRGEILASNEDFAAAMQAFMGARSSSVQQVMKAASLNAGIMALKSSNLIAFDSLLSETKDQEIRDSLTLERALWKCYQGDRQGQFELDKFIMANEGHPRENEARLALASASINTSPPDVKLAKRQLEIISPRLQEPTQQAQITQIMIRAESLLQDWEQAAKAAESFLKKFPNSPDAAAIELMRGEAYYQNEDYNKARIIFQDFKKKYPKNNLIPYTDFYAAMSARLSGTEQSREECVAMFQQIIDSKHDLADEARIQQGRVLIDLRRYEDARKTLKPLLDNKKLAAERTLGAGVLLADCYQREGNLDPEKNKEAVTIYNNLLKLENLPIAWNHRLHYLRGQAYENMKETSNAFKSFYEVIIQGKAPDDAEGKQEEWFWFYRNGFKALAMLEDAKRWEAAVRLAKRISSFNGPRAEEAAKRADDLAKKHMIWPEDEPIE